MAYLDAPKFIRVKCIRLPIYFYEYNNNDQRLVKLKYLHECFETIQGRIFIMFHWLVNEFITVVVDVRHLHGVQ